MHRDIVCARMCVNRAAKITYYYKSMYKLKQNYFKSQDKPSKTMPGGTTPEELSNHQIHHIQIYPYHPKHYHTVKILG